MIDNKKKIFIKKKSNIILRLCQYLLSYVIDVNNPELYYPAIGMVYGLWHSYTASDS